MAAPPLPLATVHDRLRAEAQAVEGCIDAHVVQRALGLRSLYLAQRLLVALSGPKRSFESAQDFIDAAEEVMAAPLPGKIDFLFRLHDADGDGYISASELERLLHIAAAEHGLRLADAEIDELVAAVMRAGDANGDGKIGLIEFIEMLLARPSMEQRLTAYGVSLLMPGERSRKESLAPGAPLIGWLRNDLPRVLWTLGIVLANLALFASAFWHHANRGAPVPVQIARGFGACLNFDAALIAVPMLRTTLMRLRRSPVGHLLPIDDAIALHALIGELVFFTALGHSAAHAWNVTLGNAPLGSRANLTGLVMLV
ncbi:MAG TPA: EF-hand domain-containing protein, partial [Polyangiales bacterium]|nr:EF-hand domain-containing protein [Polyangiales bacterium]